MGLIGAIRNKRAQFKIAPTVFLPEVIVISKESNLLDDFNALNEYFRQLGKIEKMSFVNKDKPAPKSCSVVVYKAIKAYILLEGLVDVGKESARLSKEIGAVEREIKNIQRRLENKGFLNKAPKDVVDEQKQRLDDYMLKLNELKAALKEIS
jgi:valyl-tRNA synthetase